MVDAVPCGATRYRSLEQVLEHAIETGRGWCLSAIDAGAAREAENPVSPFACQECLSLVRSTRLQEMGQSHFRLDRGFAQR
jgi:hypothetical protein